MFEGNLVNVSEERRELEDRINSAIRRYDKPQTAREIWKRYGQDIIRYGCANNAIHILQTNTSHSMLDTRLSLMIAEAEVGRHGTQAECPHRVDEFEEALEGRYILCN